MAKRRCSILTDELEYGQTQAKFRCLEGSGGQIKQDVCSIRSVTALPDELLLHILSFLAVKSLIACQG